MLWFSNRVHTDDGDCGSGAWLGAMARALARSGRVKLANIAQGAVPELIRDDCGPIRQWVVPLRAPRLTGGGLPSRRIIAQIVKASEEFDPDLVHVWGVEGFWGLLTARGLIGTPALLEMQGLRGAIAEVFHGGLSNREQLACTGLREILRRSTIFQQRRYFRRWGRMEEEMIAGHKFITVQSAWMRAQVEAVSPGIRTFHNERVLREPFYASRLWRSHRNPVVFCSAAYPAPFKGLHTAIRATAILKGRFPNIQLRVAGPHRRPGIREDGYVTWVTRQARALGVCGNLAWLGFLSAAEVVEQIGSAGVCLVPSFIENCSNAMQEAMMVGAPVVASYAGGLPSLARDDESALFFPPGDEAMCAYQLGRVLSDEDLVTRLSRNARQTAVVRNDRERLVRRQLRIYERVLRASTRKRPPTAAALERAP